VVPGADFITISELVINFNTFVRNYYKLNKKKFNKLTLSEAHNHHISIMFSLENKAGRSYHSVKNRFNR